MEHHRHFCGTRLKPATGKQSSRNISNEFGSHITKDDSGGEKLLERDTQVAPALSHSAFACAGTNSNTD
jgi:hypothetical protein